MDESMISMVVKYIKIQFVQAPQISINMLTKLAMYMDESAITLIKRCVA